MIHHHTNFTCCSGSLVFAIELKGKYRFHEAAVLFMFYINMAITNVVHFLKGYHSINFRTLHYMVLVLLLPQKFAGSHVAIIFGEVG
jgi:hypothetical protein